MDDTETTTTDEQHDDSLPPDVREGLREATVPLATTDPAADVDDLAPVVDRLADADVVGLGEATHGTREFFDLKGRILRHLVADHGVRVVAMESPLPETMALTDYVLDGEGDPREALAGLGSWVWAVESVLATVEWLRGFNADRSPEDRVGLYGVGAYHTHRAVESLRDHLAAVDPEFLDAVGADLDAVDDEGERPGEVDDVPGRVAAAERLLPALRDHLDGRRGTHVAATSERAWARARRYVAVVEQVVETAAAIDASGGDPAADEDPLPERVVEFPGRTMADNVAWLGDHADADTVVLWAHDAHVNRVAYPFEGFEAAAPSLGRHLADRHGDGYYALGFSFARGAFGAARANRGDGAGPGEVVLDGPLPGTIDAALDDLDGPLSFVDLRAAGEDERTADWLSGSRPQFRAPGTVDPDALEEQLVEHVYADAFDGLCFVGETTRARPLDGGDDGEDATDAT